MCVCVCECRFFRIIFKGVFTDIYIYLLDIKCNLSLHTYANRTERTERSLLLGTPFRKSNTSTQTHTHKRTGYLTTAYLITFRAASHIKHSS